MITRPMLAASTGIDAPVVNFPVLATPKVDGVRALKINGTVVSRNFKPIPNMYIRSCLQHLLPDGADGEIVCSGGLYSTTSVVMRSSQERAAFFFYWFDYVFESLDMPYYERVNNIHYYVNSPHFIEEKSYFERVHIVAMLPKLLCSNLCLEKYEDTVLGVGFEGVMLRRPDGRYKCGRSTLEEGLLVKIKRYSDSEALIVGTEELMHNVSEGVYDNFGRIKKRSKKASLVGGMTLGAIVAQTEDGVIFRIGTGYTEEQRLSLWQERQNISGMKVKYRHAQSGQKIAPRTPVFIGIRHPIDF